MAHLLARLELPSPRLNLEYQIANAESRLAVHTAMHSPGCLTCEMKDEPSQSTHENATAQSEVARGTVLSLVRTCTSVLGLPHRNNIEVNVVVLHASLIRMVCALLCRTGSLTLDEKAKVPDQSARILCQKSASSPQRIVAPMDFVGWQADKL